VVVKLNKPLGRSLYYFPYDLKRALPELTPIGHLAKNDRGLVLLTNSSRLVQWLLTAASRTYWMRVEGLVDERIARTLEQLEGEARRWRCVDLGIVTAGRRHTDLIGILPLEMADVRALMMTLGHEILMLRSVRVANLSVTSLEENGWCRVPVALLDRAFARIARWSEVKAQLHGRFEQSIPSRGYDSMETRPVRVVRNNTDSAGNLPTQKQSKPQNKLEKILPLNLKLMPMQLGNGQL
jgi:hypothetical protein